MTVVKTTKGLAKELGVSESWVKNRLKSPVVGEFANSWKDGATWVFPQEDVEELKETLQKEDPTGVIPVPLENLPQGQGLFTLQEISDLLDIPLSTVRSYSQKGKFPFRKRSHDGTHPGRHNFWLVPRSDIISLFSQGRAKRGRESSNNPTSPPVKVVSSIPPGLKKTVLSIPPTDRGIILAHYALLDEETRKTLIRKYQHGLPNNR